ncbi:MAG: hypothetical protein AAF125_05605, partial [Chloroflexota bacterium]
RLHMDKTTTSTLTQVRFLLKQGDKSAAFDRLKKQLKENPSAETFTFAARLITDPARKEQYLRAALRIRPDYKPARSMLRELGIETTDETLSRWIRPLATFGEDNPMIGPYLQRLSLRQRIMLSASILVLMASVYVLLAAQVTQMLRSGAAAPVAVAAAANDEVVPVTTPIALSAPAYRPATSGYDVIVTLGDSPFVVEPTTDYAFDGAQEVLIMHGSELTRANPALVLVYPDAPSRRNAMPMLFATEGYIPGNLSNIAFLYPEGTSEDTLNQLNDILTTQLQVQ